MSKKSFANITQEAVAQATAHALTTFAKKPAPIEPVQPEVWPSKAQEKGQRESVQWNVRLEVHLREKLRNTAFAMRVTERDLIEAFIAQLPDASVPEVARPDWLKKQ